MEISKDKIEEIVLRGAHEIIHKESLFDRLLSGKKLRIKFGIDPTSPLIHLGRAVMLFKLRDFQELGHKIIFIIGDTTGVIGDTSDKEAERPMLTKKDIKRYMKTYTEQAGRILDMKKVEIHYNSEWLESLSYSEIGEQADQFSLADFISRENIKERLAQGKRVSLREVLYPLMQGYDSVKVKSDIEIGGIDQRFNLLAGRKLQEYFNQMPQDIIMLDLIMGLDGRKMSSSWGNTINITDSPVDMYGKLMSVHDDMMHQYFISCTSIPLDEIKKNTALVKEGGISPRDLKMMLAFEITSMLHGKKEAENAQRNFIQVFQKKEMPEMIPNISVKKGTLLVDVLVEYGLVASKSDFRRLVVSGAIYLLDTREKIKDFHFTVTRPIKVKIGKKRFLSVCIK